MTPEIQALRTGIECVKTILIAVICYMVVKFFHDGRIEAEKVNRHKREKLDRLFRAMGAERDAALNDIVRQAEEIVAGRDQGGQS